MSWSKRLEEAGKALLAALLAALLYRPWRRRRALDRVREAARVLVVRTDNRVGEALLTTPVLASLRARSPRPVVHVLVHPRTARVLEGLELVDELIPFERKALALGPLSTQLRKLRRARYDVVVDCTNWTGPSLASAVAARLAGPRAAVIGPAKSPSRWFCDLPVPPRPDTRSEVAQRVHLLSPLPGHRPVHALSFRRPRPPRAAGPFIEGLRGTRYAVVNPGGRLGERRIPPEAFGAAARALAELEIVPVIAWGPGEEALAEGVERLVPGARRAPPTDLDELAALMSGAVVTVCNNTGPMHLSVAVGTPTLGLFLRIEMERWGHAGPPHRMVDLTAAVEARGDVAARAREETAAFARGVLAEAASNPAGPSRAAARRPAPSP